MNDALPKSLEVGKVGGNNIILLFDKQKERLNKLILENLARLNLEG